MKTSQTILQIIQKEQEVTIDELVKKLSFSRQYIHKVVLQQLDNNLITKTGKAPHTYYRLHAEIKNENNSTMLLPEVEQFLQQHFITVEATGNLLEGAAAMQYWSTQQHLDTAKSANEFVETRKKYLSYFNNIGLIDGLQKLKNTKGMPEIEVQALYYLDFNAIERFGKTKLGTLMHYAKQGQNKNLMKLVVAEIKNRIHYFLQQHQIDAVLYVPPTIKRKIQIMDYVEKNLQIDLPKIIIKKVSNEIIIPQKALAKLHERIANAKHTFIVPAQKKYATILIIDDAVGSGATINEIALKILQKKLAKNIIGLSETGSYKGFEVVSEL